MRTDKQPAGPVEPLVSRWCPNVGLTHREAWELRQLRELRLVPGHRDPESRKNATFGDDTFFMVLQNFWYTSISSWLLLRTDRNSRCPTQKCLPSQIVSQSSDPGLVCKNDLQFCKIHSATRYQTDLRNSIPSGTNLRLVIISSCIFLHLERWKYNGYQTKTTDWITVNNESNINQEDKRTNTFTLAQMTKNLLKRDCNR